MHHVTVVTLPTATGSPVGIEAFGRNGGAAHVDVFDSVVNGPGAHLARVKPDSMPGTAADIVADYLAYDPAAVANPAGGGGITVTHPFTGPPGFLNQAAADYRLAHDSPLIDAGTPGPAQGFDLTTDLGGGARFVDGDADGTVARDVGAFEYQRAAPVAAATATPAPALVAQSVDFDGSGSTDADGEALTYAWSFDDGATATGATTSHAFATPGSRVATLTVTDPAGLSDDQAVNVPVTEEQVQPPLDTTKPILTGVSIDDRVLERGKRTQIHFTLSEAATVGITVFRRESGRRVKGRCVRPTRRNRKAPHCTRFVRIGEISRAGRAGPNNVSFRGRVGPRKLPVGRYRLVFRATDAASNTSARKRLSLRIA
jgi:PKD repeat protein